MVVGALFITILPALLSTLIPMEVTLLLSVVL